MSPGEAGPSGALGPQTFLTLHYLAFFILGGLLAKKLPRVTGAYARLPSLAAAVLFGMALLLYDAIVVNHWGAMTFAPWTFPQQIADWATAAGALLLIVFSLEAPLLKRLLQHRAVHHLGRVSYSLYLVHGTVLLVFLHLDPAPDHRWLVFGLYLATVALLTELFYRSVEEPAMRLGRFLTPSRRA